MVAFSTPMLIGSLLQTAYHFIDSIWVGQFLGKTALAAITVSTPVIFLIIALGSGLTMASNILISQYFGARRHRELKVVVNSSWSMVTILSLVFMVIGALLTPSLLTLMGTPEEVLPSAVPYLQILFVSVPLNFGLFLARNMLLGIGDSKTPIIFQFFGVIANAILDPILMFGWLGLPAMGLNGAAWATVITNGLSLLALQIHLQRKKSSIMPNFRRKLIHWPTAMLVVKLGIPVAIQQSLVSIGMVFITSIVNSFGEVSMAAFGVVSRIDQVAFMPAMTLGMAVSTLAGQNIGANKPHRVQQVFRWGSVLGGGITMLVSIIALLIPETLMRIFSTDPSVLEQGVNYLRIVSGFYPFFAVMFISNGVINGAGHTLVTTLISLIGLWAVRVPTSYILARHLDSVDGVWYGIALSLFLSMFISTAYYVTGKWKKPILKPGNGTPKGEQIPI